MDEEAKKRRSEAASARMKAMHADPEFKKKLIESISRAQKARWEKFRASKEGK